MNIDDLFPLQPFAKLFETSRGQVLCTADENDEGRPSLCFQVTLKTGQLLKLAIGGWEVNDAGWQMADDALEGTTLEQAENFVTKVLPQLFEIDPKEV